jgi:hypothetical protein
MIRNQRFNAGRGEASAAARGLDLKHSDRLGARESASCKLRLRERPVSLIAKQRFLLFGVAMLAASGPALCAQEQTHPSTSIEQGQRVFTCGNSFHAWYIAPILDEIARKAGFKGHEIVGVSKIGGSKAIQHWDVPDDKNEAKRALGAGKVDVLTLACMLEPDEGIEKFATFAYQHNSDVRVSLQEFWIPWDKLEWPFQGDPETVKPDAATPSFLDQLHAPYFRAMDDYVLALNRRLGRPVVFVAPVGQAVVMLRKKVIAHEIPGIQTQAALFTDKLGHPQAPIQVLAAYCHFAVIYRRNPTGLPAPEILKDQRHPEWDDSLNRLLQEIAWFCVTRHRLSGVALHE